MGNKCCKIHPCDVECDAVIPHHMDIEGTAGWVYDFCKCPAKAGDKIELTDSLLMPGHFIDRVTFKVARAEGVPAPFRLGTVAVPDRFGAADMENVGRGLTDVRELQLTHEAVFLELLADVSKGKLVIGITLADADPYDGRDFMG